MSFSDECHIQQSEKQVVMDPVCLYSDLAMIIISITSIRTKWGQWVILDEGPQEF